MRRALLIVLTAVLVLGSVCAIYLAMRAFMGSRDPADHARVIDIKPSPDGRTAAVVYVYYHASSSATTIRVALSKPPFPEFDQDFTSKHTIAAVRGGTLTDAGAKEVIRLSWRGDGTLDVCAPFNDLILFSADGYGGDTAGTFGESRRAALSVCEARSSP